MLLSILAKPIVNEVQSNFQKLWWTNEWQTVQVLSILNATWFVSKKSKSKQTIFALPQPQKKPVYFIQTAEMPSLLKSRIKCWSQLALLVFLIFKALCNAILVLVLVHWRSCSYPVHFYSSLTPDCIVAYVLTTKPKLFAAEWCDRCLVFCFAFECVYAHNKQPEV